MIHLPNFAAFAVAVSLVGAPAWAQPAASPPAAPTAGSSATSVAVTLREALDAQGLVQAQLDAETARSRLLRERATLIEKSIRAGQTPLPDLLRALAAAAQADSAVARQTAALGLARARLQQALGLLP